MPLVTRFPFGRPPRGAPRPARPRSRGFTILEVMVAACILVLVIATSLTVLQSGMRAVDTARNLTLAGQIGQSELEVLRLKNWPQILALPASADVPSRDAIGAGTVSALDASLHRMTSRFAATRTVVDLKPNMRQVMVAVSWRGNDGRTHVVATQARFARNGLNDYIYVSH